MEASRNTSLAHDMARVEFERLRAMIGGYGLKLSDQTEEEQARVAVETRDAVKILVAAGFHTRCPCLALSRETVSGGDDETEAVAVVVRESGFAAGGHNVAKLLHVFPSGQQSLIVRAKSGGSMRFRNLYASLVLSGKSEYPAPVNAKLASEQFDARVIIMVGAIKRYLGNR